MTQDVYQMSENEVKGNNTDDAYTLPYNFP